MRNREDFERMIEPLWKAYHESEPRVPMTDGYDSLTAKQIGSSTGASRADYL